MIDFKLAGIPCKIDVLTYTAHKGDGYWAVSSEDAKDSFEATYEVCDRRGRPAPWLARKIDSKINSAILEAIGEQA